MILFEFIVSSQHPHTWWHWWEFDELRHVEVTLFTVVVEKRNEQRKGAPGPTGAFRDPNLIVRQVNHD